MINILILKILTNNNNEININFVNVVLINTANQ